MNIILNLVSICNIFLCLLLNGSIFLGDYFNVLNIAFTVFYFREWSFYVLVLKFWGCFSILTIIPYILILTTWCSLVISLPSSDFVFSSCSSLCLEHCNPPTSTSSTLETTCSWFLRPNVLLLWIVTLIVTLSYSTLC